MALSLLTPTKTGIPMAEARCWTGRRLRRSLGAPSQFLPSFRRRHRGDPDPWAAGLQGRDRWAAATGRWQPRMAGFSKSYTAPVSSQPSRLKFGFIVQQLTLAGWSFQQRQKIFPLSIPTSNTSYVMYCKLYVYTSQLGPRPESGFN